MITAFLVFFGLCAISTILTIVGTFTKNRWGINLQPVSCPKCGNTTFSTFRRPTSIRQALWGGKTCPVCGTEMDKWGRQIDSRPK
jgi:ssDNA-binding Zn-finger/Zn-ribbon topoisomerase 1